MQDKNIAQRMEWRIASHHGEVHSEDLSARSRNKVRKAGPMGGIKRRDDFVIVIVVDEKMKTRAVARHEISKLAYR